MCAITALRSEEMESLSAGGPAWLAGVSEYLVGKLGQGLPPLLARRWMNGDGRRR